LILAINGPVVIGIIAGIILLVLFVLLFNFAQLWFQALLSDCPVGIFNIVAMRLRGVNPAVIIRARITAWKAGIELETDLLEAHALAGGRVPLIVSALVAAGKADVALTFERACGIDLAGRNILKAVQEYVRPVVIDCPDPAKGRSTVDAVAMDGIQVKAKARVTVRAKIERLVGGAGEETIIARVGEGIVTTIGSAESHKRVLENPDLISRTVLAKGLDAGTAFEIVSIDIADVDVGENVGAKLQAEQAEADKRVAQALAEGRRAMAAAQEQERRAEVIANRAKLVLAEAEIPKAIAQAFREGNLGIMDYYQLRNIQSDTEMRQSISGTGPGGGKQG
jgi:uncharacterized protein YqfA (UPF0365 family)